MPPPCRFRPPLWCLLLLGCFLQPASWVVSAAVRPPRVAVVLSGGGARGGAHVGVLRALESAGIPVDLIVGTSYGGFVGCLYGIGYSTVDLEFLLRKIDWNWLLSDSPERRLIDLNRREREDRHLFDLEVSGSAVKLPAGFQKGQHIRELVDRLSALPLMEAGGDFDAFPIPFRLVATNLLNGRPYVFRNGSLSTAIRASIAVPGFFTPVKVDNALLVDGGIADNLPVDIARAEGATVVIAVDVSSPLKQSSEELGSVLDILDQVIAFQIEDRRRASAAQADVVIRPELGAFDADDFVHSHELVTVGESATIDALPAIRKILADHGIAPGVPQRQALIRQEHFDGRHYLYQEKQVEPAAVRIQGLKRRSEAGFLDRLSARPGRTVGPSALERDVAVLYGTGLFDAAGFRLEGPSSGPLLTYDLSEAASTQLAFGMRYDTEYEFTAAGELISRNTRGTGIELYANTLVGNVKHLELGLTSGERLGSLTGLSAGLMFRSRPRLLFQEDEKTG